MAKLFVFGIGGTGARVIKSLAMLLASGVETQFTEIVPIIIDPDRAGADINRTVKILNDYQRIQRELTDLEGSHFFKTTILTLSEAIARKGTNPNIIDGFKFDIDSTQNERFRNFIGYADLTPANKWFANMLFSEKNLNSTLDVGFKGNPNIGSVVLNLFSKSAAFEAFANVFDQDDRIFIISSIFGGTGAAGFPLLVKNIRQGSINGNHYQFLQNSIIGAITVQPYFKVSTNTESEIDSRSFVSKAKAALHYYHKNISGNNSINILYYIGDSVTAEYDNREGGADQRNDAHFVELSAALAVIDFANSSSEHVQTVAGNAVEPLYKEFGITKAVDKITFNDLFDDTNKVIRSKLTEFFYFNLFLKERLSSELSHPYASGYVNKFDRNFLDQSAFYKYVSSFNTAFRVWLGELRRNKISFSPYNIDVLTDNNSSNTITDIQIGTSSIFSIVNGVREKKSLLPLLSRNDYELMISELNKAAIVTSNKPTNKRFISVFSLAAKEIVHQKLF